MIGIKNIECIEKIVLWIESLGKEMKVAIVTITELDNFGNRLQNYALQETLKLYGCEVETIPNYVVYKYRKSLKWKTKLFLKWVLEKNTKNGSELVKNIRFSAFDKKYIKFSRDYSTLNYITPNLDTHYDLFITGSDQVWNPTFIFNFDFNFLRFAAPEKRIAYAASFAVDDLPDNKKELFRNYINGMRAISVREFAGAKIVETITDKHAEVVLDPTLLLTKEDWEKIEKKPRWVGDQKYILLYYLGRTEGRSQLLNNIYISHPEYKKLEIIDIHDYNQIRKYTIRPDEFIWLIHNAELVITDSFHGTVFSLLMETPFVSNQRDDNYASMNSRVESLFVMMGIEKDSSDIIFSRNINGIQDKLNQWRKKSLDYLQTSISI